MIRTILTATALALAAPALCQSADPATIASAQKLLAQMGTEQQLDQQFAALAPMMAKSAMAQLEAGEQSRALFTELTGGDYARKQKLEAIFAEEYLKATRAQIPRMLSEYAREYAATFSKTELDGLTAFFASGIGAKYVAASPALQTRLTGIGQRIGMEVGMVAVPKAIERGRAEIAGAAPK
ncbi:DUF2059 domain-containing protein [Sphingomonas sp.]|uniref:DUF2059 domain-containing protein n=1 Tax=Sphingomonas sp. TaxID=28214 RepID=UPI001ECACAB3|nr:DUF2059 domain-containing protein [Sphingomonas sp.]MBX3594930.1 DUF2059 domain-containing protein [Sphingomonas sp.]